MNTQDHEPPGRKRTPRRPEGAAPTAHTLQRRFLARDLTKHRTANLALLVLLAISALLMSTGAIVMERLIGSVDRLFAEAEPPHFLQMHRGDLDRGALEEFASQHPEIDAWLIEQMHGFDGSAIAWARGGDAETRSSSGDFSDSLIDHLFVTQNRDFDFLIDEAGAIPRPSAGEVYVPVGHQQRYGLQQGDVLRVGTGPDARPLRVAGFVRDAQMASSFASASRFLVSDTDFERLPDAGGDPEAIIEYRLGDPAEAPAFQRAYEASPDLPKNGQAVTFQMIRMINAISDGLVAAALAFASALLIAIAFINLRFVIRGSLEDDVREIGTLKAIGLSRRTIAGLYLAKYRLIALAACAIGGGLSPFAAGLLTSGIQTSYGAAPVGPAALVAPFAALALVYLLVMMVCRGVLRRIGRIEVVRALVHGSTLDERAAARQARRRARKARRSRLASGGILPLGARLAFVELRAESGRWVLLPIVFALATVLMTLPANLLTTLESPRFVTYMGAPDSELRSDLQFGADLDDEHRDMVERMTEDPRLADVRSFARVPHEILVSDGVDDAPEWVTLPVEAGDYTGTTVEFMTGTRPADGEIALSASVAEQHGIRVGDRLELRRDAEADETRFKTIVSGVYQDVTSGGRTAKLQAPGPAQQGASGFVLYADTVADADPATIASDYDERFPAASTVPMREYVHQTLSYATTSLRGAAALSFGFGVAVAALITALFLRLFLAREQRRLGVLGAIGFSPAELANGVRLKALLAVIAGTLLGAAASALLGESALSAVFGSLGLGIADLSLIPDPWLAWVAYPLALCAAGMLVALAVTARIRRQDRTAWLR